MLPLSSLSRFLRVHPWSFRAPAAAGLFLILCLQSRMPDGASLRLYLATWVIVPHVFLGVWVFVRFLRATNPVHTFLDVAALIFLLQGALHIHAPAAWCAWFGGVFTVAILKYALTLRSGIPEDLKHYSRMKIRLESPAVGGFFLAAALFAALPSSSPALPILEGGILFASLAFAVYMIALRRAYHRFFKGTPSIDT